MAVEAHGKQQLKSARMRELMFKAAISTLIEQGYGETSIQCIIERAGVSKGALQHHFPTKEDLIAGVVEKLLSRTFVRPYPLRTKKGLSDVEIVAAELRGIWSDFINTGAYRALLEILVAARTDGKLRARIEPMLHNYNEQIDKLERESYQATSGDASDVQILLVMNRALMRGLVIQDRYVSDPNYNRRVIDRWIKLVAPLLRPRGPLKKV